MKGKTSRSRGDTGLTPEAAVRLDFGTILSEEENLTALLILATGLKYMWETRVAKKVVIKYKMRAEIEAKVSLLRKTKYQRVADRLEILLNFLN